METPGFVEIPVSNPKVHSVNVTVSAPGHVPKMLSWSHREFVRPILNHSCFLEPGQTLEGFVRNDEGGAVPGARIVFHGPTEDPGRRENIAYPIQTTSVTSDDRGHFRSDQLPVIRGTQGRMSYSVLHPEYVRGRVQLGEGASLATNHIVVLQRGRWLTGVVEDFHQVPMANAEVVELETLNGEERTTATQSDGSFAIGPFAAVG